MKFKSLLHQKIYNYLSDLAAKKKFTTYKEMGNYFGIAFHHDSLGMHLGPVSEKTYEKYGFFISAIVVREEDSFPGPGLFRMAVELGCEYDDEEAFFVDQTRLIFDHFKINKNPTKKTNRVG